MERTKPPVRDTTSPGFRARDRISQLNRDKKREQQEGPPPVVPRADPPTTMAEVPPGIAEVRAAPARH